MKDFVFDLLTIPFVMKLVSSSRVATELAIWILIPQSDREKKAQINLAQWVQYHKVVTKRRPGQ